MVFLCEIYNYSSQNGAYKKSHNVRANKIYVVEMRKI